MWSSNLDIAVIVKGIMSRDAFKDAVFGVLITDNGILSDSIDKFGTGIVHVSAGSVFVMEGRVAILATCSTAVVCGWAGAVGNVMTKV
jgi:hypothetical protein